MFRARSPLAVRTLTRALRANTHVRPRPSRAANLRLDTLEGREQPGSVANGLGAGLAGAGMLEPLQIMAVAVGGRVPARAAGDVGPAATQAVRPALSFPALSSRQMPLAVPAAAADRRTEGNAAATPPADSSRAPLDLSDLSVADPAKFTPPAAGGAAVSGGGSSAGSGAGTGPAGQPAANAPATYAGSPGPDGGLSLPTDPPAPPVAGPATAPATRSAAAAAHAPVVGPTAEQFVTPPTDAVAVEPPALSPPLVPQPTTLRPTYAVGTDAGGVGKVRAYSALTGQLRYAIQPFNSSFQGGVRVAIGDVSGDGTGELVAGKGPGGDNRVKVFGGWDHLPLPGTRGSFLAFVPLPKMLAA